MRLQDFDYFDPVTMDEAVERLAQNGNGAIIAGGSDLLVALKRRLQNPAYLLSLEKISSLRDIRSNEDKLTIGSMVTLDEIIKSSFVKEKLPALKQAAWEVASPLLRYLATIGGNVCLNTRCRFYNQSQFWRSTRGPCFKVGGESCHVTGKIGKCFAAFCADIPPALIVYGASVRLAGPKGVRTIPLENFYSGEGRFPNVIAVGSREILTSIEIPLPQKGLRSVYRKFRLRDSIDFPLIGVAAALKVDAQNRTEEVKVACTGTVSAPVTIKSMENVLGGAVLEPELIWKAAAAGAAELHPLRTSLISPRYKREITRVVMAEAIAEAGGVSL